MARRYEKNTFNYFRHVGFVSLNESTEDSSTEENFVNWASNLNSSLTSTEALQYYVDIDENLA
ncbi:hypothetical protein FQA39_LY00787, partial [Lamprigera yunnana]